MPLAWIIAGAAVGGAGGFIAGRGADAISDAIKWGVAGLAIYAGLKVARVL
jgi:hypothetical protein